MKGMQARFVGVELYFENLDRAKEFYAETLGLEISEEHAGHHAKFDSPELKSAIAAIGQEKLVHAEAT